LNTLFLGLVVALFLLYPLLFLFPQFHINQTSNAQENATNKMYQNPGFGLTVTYPPTWDVDELRNNPSTPSDNSIVAIFKSPSQGINDKYLENVIINIQGPRLDIDSLETYKRNSMLAYNSMSDITLLKEGKSVLAGFPAHQMEYTSTGIPGLNLMKLQIFTVINNVAYVVTFGAEQAEYDKNLPEAEKLINSIKINSSDFNDVPVVSSDYSIPGGQLVQIPSQPTDFPGGNPSAVELAVTTAQEDSIGSYHVRGTIKNLGSSNLEFVKVTGIFYDSNHKTVGVTTCCYTDPNTIEPGRTASFDSFAQADEVSGIPTSFRVSIDWSQ